jgi:hypothetical protein
MERFIDKKFIDQLTGLEFGIDVQGRAHLLQFLNKAAESPPLKESIFLRAFSEKNWSNTTDFHTITCTLTGDPSPMVYQIPANKTLQLDNVIAVTNGKYTGISLVGVYIDNVIESFFPVQREMYYTFDEKVKIEGLLEFKFKPFHKKTKLSIFVHGILI